MFKQLKIVELATVLAGPAVGLFFAELGAEVIKIESPDGDVTRKWKLPSEHKEAQSAYFSSVNWNKQYRRLDLRNELEREQALALLSSADIVIANYKPGSAEKLGMSYEQLSKVKPDLIYGQITGYGLDSKRTAFDVVLQAESGFMSMNGEKGAVPLKMPVALIDILAAHQLKEGLLIALLRRFQTGQGSHVTVSLYDAAVASLANQATNWLMAAQIPKAIGSLHPNIAPYGETFACLDGEYIVLAIGSNAQFAKFCTHIGLPELATQSAFAENANRVRNRSALQEILGKRLAEKKRAHWMSIFERHQIPVGQVLNLEQVFNSERAQNLVLEEQLPSGQKTKRVKTAVFNII